MRIFFFLFCGFFQVTNAQVITDSITCTRDLYITPQYIFVTIRIQKPDKGGFARIYEKLPSGSTVSNVNCGTAYYKSEKTMLKIAWDEIPSGPKLEITYRVKLAEKLNDTVQAFSGTFSAEFMSLDEEQIQIGSGTKTYQKPLKETPVLTETKSDIIKEESVNHVLSIETDTYYCIQVAAAGYIVKEDYLKKQFGYDGEFEIHSGDNVYRLTIGKYKSKTEAEASLISLKSSYFKKCFLSAYQNGKKIAVSEADKILNGK